MRSIAAESLRAGGNDDAMTSLPLPPLLLLLPLPPPLLAMAGGDTGSVTFGSRDRDSAAALERRARTRSSADLVPLGDSDISDGVTLTDGDSDGAGEGDDAATATTGDSPRRALAALSRSSADSFAELPDAGSAAAGAGGGVCAAAPAGDAPASPTPRAARNARRRSIVACLAEPGVAGDADDSPPCGSTDTGGVDTGVVATADAGDATALRAARSARARSNADSLRPLSGVAGAATPTGVTTLGD
jgi:hypothetical protein